MKIKTKDGFSLDTIFNKNSSKGVVLAHGMTVNKDDEGIFVRAEKKLNELGFSTIRFDFRAHGNSNGDSSKDFTISGELIDLHTIIEFFRKEGISVIGLAGASFGGGIAALYAGKHSNILKSLFLANPCMDYTKCFLEPTTPWAKQHFQNIFDRIKKDEFIKIGSRQFKAGRKLFEEMKMYNPCEELQTYSNPLLIVHGDKDSKVSYQDVKNCFDNLTNKQKQFRGISGSEHGFHDEPYETDVVDIVVNFFKETL